MVGAQDYALFRLCFCEGHKTLLPPDSGLTFAKARSPPTRLSTTSGDVPTTLLGTALSCWRQVQYSPSHEERRAMMKGMSHRR